MVSLEFAIAQKELFDHQLFERFGSKVLTGPFKGMVIPEKSVWGDGNNGTMLLGAYESELHSIIERSILRKPCGIANFGCSFGYYAIGMALRCPLAHVWAMDINLKSEDLLKTYATINDVEDRISVGKDFSPPYPCVELVIMDIEACELEFFKNVKMEDVAHCDFIIECHDFMIEFISETLIEKFTPTHNIEIIQPEKHKIEDYPFLDYFSDVEREFAVVELRPDNSKWLACWSKEEKL